MPSTNPHASTRMEPLATLPVFFKLHGKRAVVAGGNAAAAWKTELLAAAGAHVDVYAADPCQDLLEQAAIPTAGPVTIVRRAWHPHDLTGAAIAIGALEDETDASAFRDAASLHGVPVNVIDKPTFCDFQFGTIVARSPLVIGISTDGAAPVFGQALRARIEALLPQGLRDWAQAAKDWRPAVQARGLDFRARRRFWETFTALALREGERPPRATDEAACLAADMTDAAAASGIVTLVGCGPGLPGALTFDAVQTLQSADLVLYDRDVSPSVVAMARREATKKPAEPGREETMAEVIAAATSTGRHVAWLGTGNPQSCRRWAARKRLLADADARFHSVAGLASCSRCGDRCDGIGQTVRPDSGDPRHEA